MDKINELIESETKKVDITEPLDSKRDESFPLMFIGLLSILTGMLVFIFSSGYYYAPTMTTIFPLFFTLFGTIISVLFLQIFIKTRSREKTSITYPWVTLKEKRKIKEGVLKKLKSFGYEVSKNYRIKHKNIQLIPDIYAKKNGNEYIFEIRYYSGRTSASTLQILERLGKIIKSTNKKIILVLVTKDKLLFTGKIKNSLKNWDYIIDFNSLDKLKEL